LNGKPYFKGEQVKDKYLQKSNPKYIVSTADGKKYIED